MLKKCPKKFALKEKLVGKALVLGSSVRGLKPMRPKVRRSWWSASCVMVSIGCKSVRGSLSSKGTMEPTKSPRSLV
ncbi:hypothetical protein Goklo_024952 [Gossypium klotzschianum]|uniref:Uncharacterized protein n=1 Tax=Gossypium klotzschianum TaxID=34286 RepID=A0A7J8W753_9ROSI|nr:hypothetical protein [Gossypium klotzschianum]